MYKVQRTQALNAFISEMGDAELEKSYKEITEFIKEKLKLPDEIQLQGLTIEHFGNKLPLIGCTRVCKRTNSDGSITVRCC